MTIEIVELIQSLQNGFFDLFFNFISFLGEEYVYILVLTIFYFGINKETGELLAFSLFTTACVNTIIKGLVAAKRPFEKYGDRVTNLRPDTSTGHSFPSGHTQNFTTVLFAGSFYYKKNWLLVVSGILASLMAISRMYLGVHFLEDVLTSIVLGVILSYTFVKIYNRFKSKKEVLHKIYIGLVILFTPFLFITFNKDFYTSYGLMIGFTFAMIYEKKFVNFTISSSLKSRLINIVIALVIMLMIQLGLKVLFNLMFVESSYNIILDLIRYSLVVFIGFGLLPKGLQKLDL